MRPPTTRAPGRPRGTRTVRLGSIRIEPELARALDADRRAGESLADQIERLLTAGLDT